MNVSDVTDGPRLALDTEFVWTRTYHARLGLVQIAPSGAFDRSRLPMEPPSLIPFVPASEEERGALLLDPLAADPAPIRDALEDDSCVKLLHDATQDIQHLCRWTGCRAPRSVFDTRVAAGFCGLPATLSLAALVEETLGIHLAKTETLTDWLRRPLSPQQLTYAAQDVIWLAPAARRLVALASERGTIEWMMEEMERFDDPALYATPPFSDAWKRIKAPSAIRRDDAAGRRLRALAAWREETAEARDLPRRWVAEDDVLVSAALRPPRSPQALPPRAISPSFVPGFFHALRAAEGASESGAGDGAEDSGHTLKNAPDEDPRVIRDKATELLERLARRADEVGVAPTLIATRADATAWVSAPGAPDHPFMRGWRRTVLTPVLGL